MKTYRELKIHGSFDQIVATMEEIERSLCDGWARDRQTEEDGRKRTGLSPDHLRYCFTCTPTKSRKGALLVLMSNSQNALELSNIVPHEYGRLKQDQFNDILEEFLQKFAKPAAAKTGVKYEISSEVVTIDDWFSRETAGKLREFLANSQGNTSNPHDYQRWMSFLVSAQQEGAEVHGDLLRRWFENDAGLDEFTASKLASEYQFSRDFAEASVGA